MQPNRYRFEVIAAYGLGVALPVLEVCRRRADFSDVPGYLDDFIGGALLLFAALGYARAIVWPRFARGGLGNSLRWSLEQFFFSSKTQPPKIFPVCRIWPWS